VNYSYSILGTGALGGFYGARLQRAGAAVHFLLHTDYEHVRQHGLHVQSKDGDFVLPQVHAYRHARDLPPTDVVLVCLKATQNHLLPELLPPSGAIVLMQNGLGAEEELARQIAPDRLLAGLAFLCSNKTGPGQIHHLDYGYVRLAELGGGITERMRRLAADFEQAGIPVTLAADLAAARWHKLVWNIPYNGLSVLLNATTTELMASPWLRQLVEDLMHEVVAGAAAGGGHIEESFVQKMLVDTARMKPYRTSMKIDHDSGRPMEVEAIFGNPLRAAEAAGADGVAEAEAGRVEADPLRRRTRNHCGKRNRARHRERRK
jgi:2-dehydropantoate 2-reductase